VLLAFCGGHSPKLKAQKPVKYLKNSYSRKNSYKQHDGLKMTYDKCTMKKKDVK
jgi:hypothetical protein